MDAATAQASDKQMTKPAFTPGPLTVKGNGKWPFDIETIDANGQCVFSTRMPCHSTLDKSFDDALNCVNQCGVGPFPVIDESLLRRPLESRSRPDDMTYSGSFNGAGVPVMHQANSGGSDPHNTFAWIDDLAESMMMRTVFVLLCWALIVIVGMGAGYFVAKLSF